jgi:hypothetical protein
MNNAAFAIISLTKPPAPQQEIFPSAKRLMPPPEFPVRAR